MAGRGGRWVGQPRGAPDGGRVRQVRAVAHHLHGHHTSTLREVVGHAREVDGGLWKTNISGLNTIL